MTVTAADVRDWITSGATTDVSIPSEQLERCLAAVEAHLAVAYDAPDPTTDDWDQAVIMLTARVYSRRNSPTGLAGLTDFGPVRVGRIDFDSELMMLLAPYSSIGIA